MEKAIIKNPPKTELTALFFDFLAKIGYDLVETKSINT
jgi:hypothetical protein